MDNRQDRINHINQRLNELPKGTLTYKNINGKAQPYLQWTDGGRSKSVYIKVSERERILLELEERRSLMEELELLKLYEDKIISILKRNPYMAGRSAIGTQSFESIISNNRLYVDKTEFLTSWWKQGNHITLVTRPRRFGKTLLMDTVSCFFSNKYEGKSELFEKLSVWKNPDMRQYQGRYPVIFVSFLNVHGRSFKEAILGMGSTIAMVYRQHDYLMDSDKLTEQDKNKYQDIMTMLGYGFKSGATTEYIHACENSLRELSELLTKHFSKKTIILVDEYDTPLNEAYVQGFWNEMCIFMREVFSSLFKNNPCLERGLITGITRVAKESLFSGLNNLEVCSIFSDKYAECCGFTEQEVFDILDCHNMDEKQKIKDNYDGFTIGGITDIYNPWSISCYLDEREILPYWVNSGGMGLVSDIMKHSNPSMKKDLETLISGGSIHKSLDENMIFAELDKDENTLWMLLVMAGYLRADNVIKDHYITCDLSITNRETIYGFRKMIRAWFNSKSGSYNDFCDELLRGDVEGMNYYFEDVVYDMISVYDTGNKQSARIPERFYHGLVLGLMVELRDKYRITSNRESGFGRYDIMLFPLVDNLDGIIIEFKVRNPKTESSLEVTARNGLAQIDEKNYQSELIACGIPENKIRKYAFAFEGKEVFILDNRLSDSII